MAENSALSRPCSLKTALSRSPPDFFPPASLTEDFLMVPDRFVVPANKKGKLGGYGCDVSAGVSLNYEVFRLGYTSGAECLAGCSRFYFVALMKD